MLSKKTKNNFGTPQEYFPLYFPVAPIEESDLAAFGQLTPEHRVSWLLMIQELIRQHYKSKKLRPFDRG